MFNGGVLISYKIDLPILDDGVYSTLQVRRWDRRDRRTERCLLAFERRRETNIDGCYGPFGRSEAEAWAVWVWRVASTHAWAWALALCLCGCAGCAARARRRWKGCGRDMRTTRRRRHLHHHMLAEGPRAPPPRASAPHTFLRAIVLLAQCKVHSTRAHGTQRTRMRTRNLKSLKKYENSLHILVEVVEEIE